MKTNRVILLSCLMMLVCVWSGFADNQVMFNYQGRVKVQGQSFTGTGQFKFAIVSTSGSETLWSNDGTSVGGGEPTASLSLVVDDGIFNVMIGDTSLGMDGINSAIFNTQTPPKLRTWFSDGVHGFQQLLPDKNLVNLSLQVLSTGDTDFTIYVNGATGNDNNNGLSPSTAKQTIQAAVDTLPDRLKCNVTIDIADGIYREDVRVFGVIITPGKYLVFKGDESWTPASPGSPAVRITGTDNDITHTFVRGYGIWASDCSGVTFQGLLLDYATTAGLRLDSGTYQVTNCKLNNSGFYGAVGSQTYIVFTKCIADNNGNSGFTITRLSYASLNDCKARFNGYAGVRGIVFCECQVTGSWDFSNNGGTGVQLITKSVVTFPPTTSPGSGLIMNNGSYSAAIGWQSLMMNMSAHTTYNNPIFTDYGGTYYN